MEIENLKANLINGISSFRIVIGILIVFVVGYLLVFGGCGKRVGDTEGSSRHAVLIVTFSDDVDADTVRIKNALRVGGVLKCGSDEKYVEVIESIDKTFELRFAALDSKGSYQILPAVLNWISSQGWTFQQKFCINMNHANAEYYFVK